jgi:type IV secretory pathway protease TraF
VLPCCRSFSLVAITKSSYDAGDKIIFTRLIFKDALIKYVAGVAPSEWCIDEDAVLWVDTKPVAQINIKKYPSKIPTQSECQRLRTGEILALGDHPDSYDSRYFGPIKNNKVIAQVELLW